MNKRIISYKRFNPNFHHIKDACKNDDIRIIFLIGGSSSGKSFSDAQHKLTECISKGYNTMVFRKTGATIENSIYKTYQEAARSLKIEQSFTFQEGICKCFNGSYITFKGLDDPEKIKGLESYQYVVCEEFSEFDIEDFKQIRKRLRGKKGQKIICILNPISKNHWIKQEIIDKENLKPIDNHFYGKLKNNIEGGILPKEYSLIKAKYINSQRTVYNPKNGKNEIHPPDMMIIQSTYLNNFWIVGSPCGKYGFYDRQVIADFEKDKTTDPYYYEVYALGEWGTIKTGGEFWNSFDSTKTTRFEYNNELPIHISIDNNVLPYISISLWQIKEGDIKEIRQIHEIAAEDPFNTVTKAAELTVKYLKDINYNNIIFLYGDASTKAGNTIDDEKRSFLDKFKDTLESSFRVEERIPPSNPSVSMSGEFINSIYSGKIKNATIEISDKCKKSIEDYENVKKDVNGGILKVRIKDKQTGQSYEKYGHFSDCKRYFITQILNNEYIKFSLKRKRNSNKEENMLYFNTETSIKYKNYLWVIMPDCNRKLIMVKFGISEFADILEVIFKNEMDTNFIVETIKNDKHIQNRIILFESDKAYFNIVRKLRDNNIDVRAMSEKTNYLERIEANQSVIKSKFRFRSDYELFDNYILFMNNIFDFNQKDNYEALNAISLASTYILRNYWSK